MKIEYLKLSSSNLKAQLRFYEQVLRLQVQKLSKEKFRVKIGHSLLEFQQDDSAKPYHVAFHIPPFQEQNSIDWLEQEAGLEILKDGEDKVIDFPAWKAKSVYFYDADKNVVEFISREDLFEPVAEKFSEENILGIAEIGLATENVEEKFNFLNQEIGLTKFTGDYKVFCAIGDDEGLFIVINKHEKDWIPTGDKAYASPFEIKIAAKNALFGASYKDERLTLL